MKTGAPEKSDDSTSGLVEPEQGLAQASAATLHVLGMSSIADMSSTSQVDAGPHAEFLPPSGTPDGRSLELPPDGGLTAQAPSLAKQVSTGPEDGQLSSVALARHGPDVSRGHIAAEIPLPAGDPKKDKRPPGPAEGTKQITEASLQHYIRRG
ncbi:hypothetical protein QJS04_geneDACA017260 [Acorus gramineus]|uniref:Uncharacterized protein n=1 Tax=Acorus gramineus TaxID=55184 RepID=A0AAV9A2U6_ACOGR|nr:hypothetical protein QJS04_geneDACA017260 [Acorus gramineus]